jgi:phosphoglycolate phosphatase
MRCLTLSTYQHIVWDWNGTLLNDVSVCVEVVNEILEQHRMPLITTDYYRTHFDFPVKAFYEGLGFAFASTDYSRLADDYIAIYRIKQLTCPLHAHAARVLALLQANRIEQSILSAYHGELLREVVGHFGIAEFFTRIQGLDNLYAASKISQGQKLMEQLMLPPDSVILIGDTTHDAEVARALGVDCLLIGNGHQHAERLQHCGTPVLNSLAALPDYLGLGGCRSIPS